MSEWLTTGQMIDTLKVGEVAESPDRGYEVQRTERGIVFSDRNPLEINSIAIDCKWRILPKFVSFDDAMKAHEAGMVVFYHGHIDVVELWDKLLPDQKHIRVSSTDLGEYSLLGMWKGKWTIEDDSNE